MKKIYTLLAIAATLLLASCDKFLNREPITNITPEKYFKSADELAAYTINYYTTFFTSYAGNYSVGVIWEDAFTDNLVRDGSGNGTALQYFSASNTRWLVPTGQATSTLFHNIRVCNYFFEQVLPKMEDGTLSGKDVEHYVGEMYVMRAQAYFSALRTFGDFPIIEEVLPDDREVLIEASKRAPRNEVARFILSDLDKAASLLNLTDKRRITKDLALLIKSRVALYEATFEKYHKGSGRVPGDANWPGAKMSYNSGKSFNIETEVNFFLDQCLAAAEQVADAHTLVNNTGVMNPTKAATPYGWNPYFEMFSQPDPSSVSEVLLWREYNREQNVASGQGPYIYEGGNCGATRSHIDGFLMKNGLPIYASGSGYKGDESLDLQQEGRDDRDYAVGLEGAHLRGALLCARECRIGRDVEEGRVRKAELVELVGHGFGEAVLVEESVGHDEGALSAERVFELVKRDGRAALFDINLFGSSEPKHILSPFGDGLDIQQVLYADVFADAVAAPGAASERKRRRELEVIKISDPAVRGGSVDEHAAGLHPRGEGVEPVSAGGFVEIDRGGVAVAAVGDEALRLCEGVFEVFGLIHREHRRELFVREFFRKLDAFDLADEYLRALRHLDSGEGSDREGALSDDFGVQRAVDDDRLSDLFELAALEEVAAAAREFILDRGVDLFVNDYRLLGGADHSVVEGL